ncbi:MAG: hypothetical protein P8M72_05555 [Gammaproteobacteria bacterium]|nr:hypothetical protein [Gammaproteobacteria bacterium]
MRIIRGGINQPDSQGMTRHKLQLLIYLSALLLSVSVFLPLTSFPVYGEVSYYRIAQLESWLVIGFALSSPGLILAGKEKWSIISLLGVWSVLLFPAAREALQSSNASTLERIGLEVTAAMSDFSTNLFLNMADFHWGGFVFLAALLLYTSGSILYFIK